MSKFKKGDRVRVLKRPNSWASIRDGKYPLRQTFPMDVTVERVETASHGFQFLANGYGWSGSTNNMECYELITEEPKFKVGDRVRFFKADPSGCEGIIVETEINEEGVSTQKIEFTKIGDRNWQGKGDFVVGGILDRNNDWSDYFELIDPEENSIKDIWGGDVGKVPVANQEPFVVSGSVVINSQLTDLGSGGIVQIETNPNPDMSWFYKKWIDSVAKDYQTNYVEPIKKDNIITKMKKLTPMLKRMLDKKAQTLYKAGYINGDLELTEDGRNALNTITFDTHRDALVTAAKEALEEEKEDNK